MALSKVWVFAETDENGSLTTLSKELLTKARDLGDTVEAFYAGDGNDIAESAGAFGATAVHATGPIEGQLLGAPVGAALAAAAEGVDLLLGGTSYDARDAFAVASVKLDKPVISNTTAIDLDGDAVVTTVPVFGGEKLVKTKFTAGGPMLCLVRPKSYEASESGGGTASVSSVDVPGDAPSATVLVDQDACTLCLSCVSLCPSGALGDNPDLPQLRFQEDACLQCGLCATVCPENAIALEPRLNLDAAALSQAVLNEEEPFPCVECGTLFGVKSTIDRITDKLRGHAMFDGDRLRMIQMCDDCRINAQYHSADNPLGGPDRPRPRTTDDYLSGRRDH